MRYARAVTVGARACMTEDRGRAGFVKDDDDACSPKMSFVGHAVERIAYYTPHTSNVRAGGVDDDDSFSTVLSRVRVCAFGS